MDRRQASELGYAELRRREARRQREDRVFLGALLVAGALFLLGSVLLALVK